MWLNPALQRHPEETQIVGHMLLSYGELELMIGECLAHALGHHGIALKTMFRILGESYRVSAADAMMRDLFSQAGLSGEYGLAFGAMKWCIRLRNQYAHCQWADHAEGGLFFTNLQEAAKSVGPFEYWWRHIDVPLVTQQAEYFDYTAGALQFVHYEALTRARRAPGHNSPKPKAMKPPPLHNPPLKHIPPWLDQDEQRHHIECAQAQERSDRSREEAQSSRSKPVAVDGES